MKHTFVSFLTVGHTNEYIDQSFSLTADRLRSNDAVSFADMKSQLRTVYNRRKFVRGMYSVKIGTVCALQKCCKHISVGSYTTTILDSIGII